MLILSSIRFAEHTTPPGHPESPERAQVFDRVATAWSDQGVRTVAPRPATHEELRRVHDGKLIEQIAHTAGSAVALDPDTFTSPESYDIALLAAGAAVQAVEHALDTGESVLAMVRPPGHHAERDRAMGFCLFNNVAVAAAAGLARGLSRIAVVDIDVHHGNGTQAIFYDDPRVLYVSTHQFPFYPGTGSAEETGTGRGTGFTMNVPLAAGAGRAEFTRAYVDITRRLRAYAPELLIVSAGFDAHEQDPLASMRLTTNDYVEIVDTLAGAATDMTCPLALVTEGGYDLDALGECLDATVRTLGARHRRPGRD